MKDFLYGAFAALAMFGLGKIIYNKGKRDGRKTCNLLDVVNAASNDITESLNRVSKNMESK